jgi:hypothetical protein
MEFPFQPIQRPYEVERMVAKKFVKEEYVEVFINNRFCVICVDNA